MRCASSMAITSRSWAVRRRGSTRSASTTSGVWSSGGTVAAARQKASISTTTATDEANHGEDKPATVGEILVEEFMQPMGLTQAALAEAMGVQRKHVNELCNNRRTVTAATALILARVFGNSPDFWLNVQRRSDLWEAMNSPRERERIERAKPLEALTH